MTIYQNNQDKIAALRDAPATGQVLTLYLPLDATPAMGRGYVALAKSVINALERDHDLNPDNVARVLTFVQETIPQGRTLVIFSSTEGNIFETFNLQVRLPAAAHLDSRPYMAPIDAARDNYPTVAVVALDEHEAKIILTDMAEVESSRQVHDDVPHRQRQGGWAAFRYERDRVEHVREHFRHVVDAVQDLYRGSPFKRMVVAGSSETAAAFVEALPKELQATVAGTLPVAMYESDHDIVETALPIAEAAERQEEVDLVKLIRDRTLSGTHGCLGWVDTVQALTVGRVQRLAIAERLLGSTAGDQAVALAWRTRAEVEFLRGEAEEILADNGGIGALLRY